MGFWKCFFYFCFTGAMGFILGRLLPPRWFHPEMRGFRCLPFEKDGKLFEKLHVRRWQQLLPDMSRILPWAMPQKKLSGDYAEKLPRMLQKVTGKTLDFHFSSGNSFPEDLSDYKLVIHCGGCMLPGREILYRMKCAADQNVPITNYGIALAHLQGILERSISLFPDLIALLH